MEILSRDTQPCRHTIKGNPDALSQNKVWWEGPNFLHLSPSEWPKGVFAIVSKCEEAFKEIIKNPPALTFALSLQQQSYDKLSDIIDINRFSSTGKVLRVLGWVFRFIDNARSIKKQAEVCITASELENAENFVQWRSGGVWGP